MGSPVFGVGFVEYAKADMLRLQRLAFMLTGTREDAQDLVQETLTKVGLVWARIDDRGPHGYATTVMSRAAWRAGRKANIRRMVWSTDASERVGQEDERIEQFDERQRLRAAMLELGVGQRTVLALRYYCDQSDTQIGITSVCSASPVRSQAFRGLRHLREALGQGIADNLVRSPRGEGTSDE